MSTYTPDTWVIVRMKTSDETVYKVLAGWYGGFSTGDSWKLSSGITQVKEFAGVCEFLNYCGSTYECFDNAEGLSSLTNNMLQSWTLNVTPESLSTSIERISIDEFLKEWHSGRA
jgi:hypothetical protein